MRLWNGKYVPRNPSEEEAEKMEFAVNNPSMYELTKELFEANEGERLRVGDKVKMVNCYEATMDKYKDRVWTVKSNSWIIGTTYCVMLEGFSGGFSVKCLKRVEGDEQ